MFRKFILRNFALDYITPVGNFVRAANWIFPGFVAMGTFGVVFDNDTMVYVSLVYTLIAVFFGFIYFRLFPLKEEEYDLLSETQKYAYDFYYNRNPKEPQRLDKWALVVNPFFVGLFIVLWCVYR